MNYIRKDLYIKTVLGALKCDNGYELLLQDKIIVLGENWSSKRDFQEWCTKSDRYVPDEHKIAIPKGRYVLYREDASGIFIAPIEDFEIKTYGVAMYYDEKELGSIIVPDDDEWDDIVSEEAGLVLPKSIIHPFSNCIFWDLLSNDSYQRYGYPFVPLKHLYDEEIIEYHNRSSRNPSYIFWGEKDIYVGIIHTTIEFIEKTIKAPSLLEQIDSIVHYLLHCDVDKIIDTFSIVSDDYIAQPPGRDHSYWEYKIYKHVEDEYIDTLFPHDKIETDHYRDCIISYSHGEVRKYIEEENELKEIARKKYDKEEHYKYLISNCIKRFMAKNNARDLELYSSLLNIIPQIEK